MRLIFLLLFSYAFLSATELIWMHDLNEAKTIAQRKHKPIILFIHSRNCYYCPLLIERVFPDEELQKKLKSSFILLSLDGSTGSDSIEEDVNDQAPARFITSMTPAFYFFGPDEEKFSQKGKKHMLIYGYWTPKELISWANNAVRRFNHLYIKKYPKIKK